MGTIFCVVELSWQLMAIRTIQSKHNDPLKSKLDVYTTLSQVSTDSHIAKVACF